MKFQNPSTHGSEAIQCIKKHNTWTHEPEAICPSNFFDVGGIMSTTTQVFVDK